MIGEINNHSQKFYRAVVNSVKDTLHDTISWVNEFEDKSVEVKVPVYYAMRGSYDFLLQAFKDDIPSSNRKTDLNTDIIPRCNFYLSNITYAKENMRNPNVLSAVNIENKENIKRILTKLRLLPVTIKFTTAVLVESELDALNVIESMSNELLPYKITNFTYYDMRIDISLNFEDSTISINREVRLDTNEKIKVEFEITVNTIFPAFNKNQNDSSIRPVVFTNTISSATTKK